MDKNEATDEATEGSAPALKNWFDKARFMNIAGLLGGIHRSFDRKRFLKEALVELDELSLLQRLRRMTECTHRALGMDYLPSVEILKELAPKIDHSFVTLFLPDYVGVYGKEHFNESMEALKFFTPYGSSEFAVRAFLKQDLRRSLKVMRQWSEDEDEHVRRLASEGSRPRLPWSFRLDELIRDPSPALPILEKLKADPSLYVRKSVANHLNDITKDHPDHVLKILQDWGLDDAHTAWIAKRALRTLIKKGNKQALGLFGAGQKAQVDVRAFELSPQTVALGEALGMKAEIASTSVVPQRLVIDYAIHYVKKAGGSSAKVFKWKELTLEPGSVLILTKRQRMQNFTTRVHYAGGHQVDLVVNGEKLASGEFVLNV